MPADIVIRGEMVELNRCPAVIRLWLADLDDPHDKHPQARISLEYSDYRIACPRVLMGYWLRTFADQLMALREGKADIAKLKDWDDFCILRAFAVHPGRGRIWIEGHLGYKYDHSSDYPRSPKKEPTSPQGNPPLELWGGCQIAFNGFEIDQTDALQLARDINEHIHASGVDCSAGWLEE